MDLKAVYAGTDPSEFFRAQMILRENGIEPVLENQASSFTASMIPTAAVPLVISVPEDVAEKALALLRDAPKDEPETGANMRSFPCACGRTLDVPDEESGHSIECPWCGKSVIAP